MNRKTIRILMLLLVAMSLGIGETKAEDNVKYIDADGKEQKQNGVTVLTGNLDDVNLSEEWYVFTGVVSLSGELKFSGDAHLILADDAQVTMNKIVLYGTSLTIYGQANGTGRITATSSSSDPAILIRGNVIFNGGQLIATGSNSGASIFQLSSCNGISVKENYSLTINGGQVTATSSGTNCCGIYVKGSLTINGGQVTASGNGQFDIISDGNDSGGTVTCGWTNSSDFIKCSLLTVYDGGTIKVASDKSFMDFLYDGGKERFSKKLDGNTDLNTKSFNVLRPSNYISVKYLDWDSSQKKLEETTTPSTDNVWELTGTETELGLPCYDAEGNPIQTWYVTTSKTATFTNTITLKGNVHIILADGTTMSVGTSGSPISGSGIVSTGSYNYNLSIHGQEGSTGKLNVFANGDAGIGVKDLTICGGRITNSNIKDDDFCDGINSTGNFVIYGGQVTSTSTVNEHNFGIEAKNFTLGWSDKENDFIQSSSYSVPDKQMRTADGKSFAVYSISGTTETLDGVVGEASGHIFLNNDNWSYGGYDYAQTALASKKLRPFEGSVVGAVVGQQYLAYNNKNSGFKLLNGDAKLYVVTSVAYNENKFEVGLTEVDAGMVKAGVPVIFANATEGNPLPVSIYLENSTASAVNSLKNFIACDGAKTVAELLIAAGLDYDDMLFFGLSGTSFKRVLLAKNNVPASGKCFLAIPKQAYMDGTLSLGTAGSGTRSLGIEMGGTTSLIDKGQLTMDNSAAAQWYSLDGRSLSKEPAQKGVYIRNGKKLVIR